MNARLFKILDEFVEDAGYDLQPLDSHLGPSGILFLRTLSKYCVCNIEEKLETVSRAHVLMCAIAD